MKKIKVIANVTDNNLFCKTVKDNFDFLIFLLLTAISSRLPEHRELYFPNL